MKKILGCLAIVLLSFSLAADNAPPKNKVVPAIVDASVLVAAGDGSGSGVIFKNNSTSFVWTDAHVVECLQQVKTVIDPATGKPKVSVTYGDVWAVQEDIEGGRMVGELKYLGKIVRYSRNHDIALIQIHKKNFGRTGVTFEEGTPEQGDKLWHVGSMKGKVGHNSVSEIIFASTGRLRRDCMPDHCRYFLYDQFTGVFHRGSSGGGVFRQDNGRCVGLITEFLTGDGHVPTYGAGCMTPSRRLIDFAKQYKCEWAVNHKVAVPGIDKEPVLCDEISVPGDWPKEAAPAPPGPTPTPSPPTGPFDFLRKKL